jgi:hypothetical protein
MEKGYFGTFCKGLAYLKLHPEDEGSMDIIPQHYMVSQSRRPQLETSLL